MKNQASGYFIFHSVDKAVKSPAVCPCMLLATESSRQLVSSVRRRGWNRATEQG